ncbi:VCBS repeat-containing protein [Aquiflexum gelatinilyticum]|uniref:VCBS repeat-containing protein n=1 Tax=Aquiflexum gelatinilyticum TaxID=2961943 RepID=A0A9X2SYD8_9BACT|nr:VCBS repeat-containing protein [Aquiflexum gelatinilyticum]MCR9015004.1 VCBS repeat-containing protein [Aquiflexum gelatinilyticum]
MRLSFFYLLSFGFLILSCSQNPEIENKFELLSADYTGIEFNNRIDIDESFNVLDFDYIYNGGGVAVGDFNGDSLPDIFFTGNMVSSKLYLNMGEFKFKDITEIAQTNTNSWTEGVTLVDINNDGLLDIYVSVSNRDNSFPDPNLLFVNQGLNSEGIPLFKEMASNYGIADRGYNTQAAFFDYDRDGDLDLYILSNALESFQRNLSRPKEKTGKGKSNDKLYKNNGDGTFINVTTESGILIEGYGLGLAISDINQDGWPDIYIANDFITNDLLYINNRDGTFSNRIGDMMNHQSFNAMGVDVADFNNDALPDVVALDMFPPDNLRQKTMFAPTENYDLYQTNLDRGYEPQYVRNTLQLNRGNGTFSEIGFLSGIFQTDWSWSPLLADFDNDGNRDLFISNGYGKDVTDLDYINFTQNLGPFTTPDERRKLLMQGLESLKEVRLPNYVFRNNADLTFGDKSEEWGITHPSISNGVAYTDLDNDGDLDLVINNLNETAFVYKNTTREKQPESTNYLKISFEGPSQNKNGIGAKVYLNFASGDSLTTLYHEHYSTRGYKSYVESIAHFGIGKTKTINELKVIWPDGKTQLINDIPSNQKITLNFNAAVEPELGDDEVYSIPEFIEVSEDLGIDYFHHHISYKDFNRQRLLPHKHSENGPGIAVGDVNGDGMEDFFIGGSKDHPGEFFIQAKDGRFTKKKLDDNSPFDDMGCLLFDANGDGNLDLYVVSGGSRYQESSPEYQDRLYTNDGKGNFRIIPDLIPDMAFSGSVVTAADYDGDGDLDLFVGGRVKPGQYPLSPKSVILENRGDKFSDVSNSLFAGLDSLGMVTAALWTDFDLDGLLDLIVVGEWMPVKFLKQNRKTDGAIKLLDVSADFAPQKSTGWWNSIISVDLNKNGKKEYILGNLGLNSRWKANPEQPLIMIAKDFDANKSVDPIMFQYLQNGFFAVPGRDMVVSQVPSWKNRFLVYSEYANRTLNDFFASEALKGAHRYEVDYFQSAVMENNFGNKFSLKSLPVEAQFAPQYGIIALDNSIRKNQSLLMIGNFYGNETVTGRYDASKGLQVEIINGELKSLSLRESGLVVNGQGRALAVLRDQNGNPFILAAQHGDSLKVFKNREVQAYRQVIKLGPLDYLAEITFKDGSKSVKEFYYGDGYLSQSSRIFPILEDYQKVEISDYKGGKRVVF